MRYLIFLLATVFALAAWQAFSNDPVVLAVLDTPLDPKHPALSAYIDEGLMDELVITGEDGNEKTWKQINQEVREALEARIDQGLYEDQILFLDSMNMMMGKSTEDKEKTSAALKHMVRGFFKYVTSRKFRRGLDVVGNYLHGTHVAGIAVRGLTDVRLINLALPIGADSKMTVSQILEFDPVKEEESIRKYFTEISQMLQRANARVVNLSIGTSEDIAFKGLKKKAGLIKGIVFRRKLKERARLNAEITLREFEEMAEENPQAVFVYAAGNSGRNLDERPNHSGDIKGDNIITVGSLKPDESGLSKFSVHGKDVEVATHGVGIVSALMGGGKIHLTGTSMASPKVAEEFVHLMTENPAQTGAQAVVNFLENSAVADERLAEKVFDGMKLKPRPYTPDQVVDLDATDMDADQLTEYIQGFSDSMKQEGSKKLDLVLYKNNQVVGIVSFEMDASGEKINVSAISLVEETQSKDCPELVNEES